MHRNLSTSVNIWPLKSSKFSGPHGQKNLSIIQLHTTESTQALHLLLTPGAHARNSNILLSVMRASDIHALKRKITLHYQGLNTLVAAAYSETDSVE